MDEVTARISRKEGDENDSDRGQQLIHGKGGCRRSSVEKETQEEVTQKTIALCIRTTKLTADVLKAAMRAYLWSHNKSSKRCSRKRLEKLQ